MKASVSLISVNNESNTTLEENTAEDRLTDMLERYG